MPTLLELVGLSPPRNCDGKSLLPFCAGQRRAGWRDEVHWSFDFSDIQTRHMEQTFELPSDWCHLQVLRTDKLKYVHFAGLPPVLFDMADDPHELINRAGDPAKASLRLEGLERMMTWRQRSEERTLTGFLARSGKFYRDDI
jgi:arylsulfatase A-like enzyme